jgi:integrase
MASVRQRPGSHSSSWAVLYRDNGRQRSRTFLDEKSANRHCERIERFGVEAADRILDAETGVRPDAMPTVIEQLQRHIGGLSGVQPDTIRSYLTIAKQIEDSPIGHLPLDALSRDDVAAWVRAQETAGNASKTVRNRQSLLSAALARAVEHDRLIQSNPAHRIRIARTERREMTFLTPAEFDILLRRTTEHYRPLVMTMYGTGLRLGEVTALRVEDLHLDDTPATLTIARAWKRDGVTGAPKSKAGRRTLAIPRPVVDVIRPLVQGRAPGELVFTNTAGRRVLQASLHDLWQGWIADTVHDARTGTTTKRTPALGKRPRIHDLRHSHAAMMIGAGINLYDLRHRMGHESIHTTADTYGHLMPEAQVQAERAATLAFTVQPLPQLGP